MADDACRCRTHLMSGHVDRSVTRHPVKTGQDLRRWRMMPVDAGHIWCLDAPRGSQRDQTSCEDKTRLTAMADDACRCRIHLMSGHVDRSVTRHPVKTGQDLRRWRMMPVDAGHIWCLGAPRGSQRDQTSCEDKTRLTAMADDACRCRIHLMSGHVDRSVTRHPVKTGQDLRRWRMMPVDAGHIWCLVTWIAAWPDILWRQDKTYGDGGWCL